MNCFCPTCDPEKKTVVPMHDGKPNICPDCEKEMAPFEPEKVPPSGVIAGQKFEVNK